MLVESHKHWFCICINDSVTLASLMRFFFMSVSKWLVVTPASAGKLCFDTHY